MKLCSVSFMWLYLYINVDRAFATVSISNKHVLFTLNGIIGGANLGNGFVTSKTKDEKAYKFKDRSVFVRRLLFITLFFVCLMKMASKRRPPRLM